MTQRVVQYVALQAPVSVPPEPQLGWLSAWSEPVRRATPRQSEVAAPVYAQPAPAFGWFTEFAQPVRRVAPRQSEVAAPVFSGTVVTVPAFGWFSEFSQPVRRIVARQSEMAAPVFAQPAPSFSWFGAWSEPVRRVPGRQSEYAAPVFTPVPIVVPPMSWMEPWPAYLNRLAPRRQDENAAPVFAPSAAIAPAYGWFMAWSEPVRRIVARQSETAAPVFAPAFTLSQMGWNVAWPEYLSRPKRVQDLVVQPTFRAPDPSYGWFSPLSEPVRRTRAAQVPGGETHVAQSPIIGTAVFVKGVGPFVARTASGTVSSGRTVSTSLTITKLSGSLEKS